jgi:hypothetical protein
VWLHGPEKGRLGEAVAATVALLSSLVTFSCFLFHKYMYTSSTGWNCRYAGAYMAYPVDPPLSCGKPRRRPRLSSFD